MVNLWLFRNHFAGKVLMQEMRQTFFMLVIDQANELEIDGSRVPDDFIDNDDDYKMNEL